MTNDGADARHGPGVIEPPAKRPSGRLPAAVEPGGQARRVTWMLWGVLVGIGTLIRIPQLSHSLYESYAFRQTQTAFIIQKYASDGIDLSLSPLPVFGRDSNVPLELPLFQALGALLVQTGLTPDTAARLLALISFQAAGLMLSIIVCRWHGGRVAVVALALFEFLPFGLYWGAASLIDFFSVALALTMVYFLDRWFNGGSTPTLVAGSVAGVLAFLVKPTTAPSWSLLLLASAAMVIHRVGWRAVWKRMAMGFAVGPGLGLVAATIWTMYADSVKKNNPLTEFLVSSALRDWSFGTPQQRANPDFYLAVLDSIGDRIAGPLLLTVALGAVAALFLPSPLQRMSTCGWLLVAISAPFVFLNLYYMHAYYLIATYPAIVTVMAIGIVWAARFLTVVRWQRFATVALTGLIVMVVGLLTPEARLDVSGLFRGQPVPESTVAIRAETPTGARIITIGCDWDPTHLYYAQREGVMFRDPTSGSFWEGEPITDYPFLLSCHPGLDPEQWLPAGYTAVAGRAPGLYRVVRNP